MFPSLSTDGHTFFFIEGKHILEFFSHIKLGKKGKLHFNPQKQNRDVNKTTDHKVKSPVVSDLIKNKQKHFKELLKS